MLILRHVLALFLRLPGSRQYRRYRAFNCSKKQIKYCENRLERKSTVVVLSHGINWNPEIATYLPRGRLDVGLYGVVLKSKFIAFEA